MGRVSTKENKNIYQTSRESLGYSRARASREADGKIEGDEMADFVKIQEDLEKTSITVEALQLWT